MFLSNQDVQKQRVREQQNQLDRADFEKSTRRDQMVRTMNESEDRIMQKDGSNKDIRCVSFIIGSVKLYYQGGNGATTYSSDRTSQTRERRTNETRATRRGTCKGT